MQLLQHFKELTIRPKNAEDLKGLILQLAIQGKLTANWREQNTHIEPASELLNRIQKEKEDLVKAKKIKKEKALPKLSEEEIPYEVPENWSFTRLGIYTHNFGQKTPDRNFEYIDVASIDNQLGIIKNGLNILNPDEAPSRARKIVQKGCVIYSTVRPYLLNIACVDRDFENEAIASTAFSILNPILGCSPFYLYHLLRSFYFIEYVNAFSKGVAYPAINDKNLLNAPIPIPPLEEQKEIVNVVEMLFKEVEQLEQLTVNRIGLKEDFVTSALNQLTTNKAQQEWTFLQEHFKSFFNETTNIKKLRETVLQLAVQGKLTADWRASNPDSEDASILLERIQEEKAQLIRDKKIKKEKALPKITKDEIPYELPDGWIWCRMGSVTDIQRGSSPRPKGDPLYFSKSETKNHWISIKDISKYAKDFILKDTDEYLTDLGINYSRYVNINELIVAVSGSTTGKCCLTGIEGYIYDGLAVVRLVGNAIEPQFHLMYYQQLYNHMNNSKFGAAFPNINTKFLNEMMFPFPPIKEQKVIIQKVNALMGLCDKLEQEVKQSQEHSEQLMQSCLREVFEENKNLIDV